MAGGWSWFLDFLRVGYVLGVAVAAVKAWREEKQWWKERIKELRVEKSDYP